MRFIFWIFLGLLFPAPLLAQIAEPDSNQVDWEESEWENDSTAEEHEDLLQYDVQQLFIGWQNSDRFYFDSTLIPAKEFYQIWDTMNIDPYRADLLKNPPEEELILGDTVDCFFYPPTLGPVTSGFGYRRWGRRTYKFHYGIDFGMRTGDPVYAAFDGVVRISKYSPSYGYMVVIRHYNGFETLYGHFSQLLCYPGQLVKSGMPIGLAGSTGHSTGSHLHFEIRFKGKNIDPAKVISFDNRCLISDTICLDGSYFQHYAYQKVKGGPTGHGAGYYGRYYTIRRGDTLGGIAHKTGVPVKTLCRLNRLKPSSRLVIGRRIRLR